MDQWVKDGFVATEGDAIDYDLIESNIKNKAKNTNTKWARPWKRCTQHLIYVIEDFWRDVLRKRSSGLLRKGEK